MKGLSTGELMGVVVSKLKAGGSWDPIISRFSWWVLDGPPLMESLTEPILECTIPSIEQVSFASALIKNCRFKYDSDALRQIVEWSNSMKVKSMSLFRLNADITVPNILFFFLQAMNADKMHVYLL
jgi:hypothetical protein